MRGPDSKPRKRKKLKEPQMCSKHSILQVRRRPTRGRLGGDLRCMQCYSEKARVYRKNNTDRYKANQRKCYLENPKAYMLYRAKGRAKRDKLPFDLRIEDFEIPTVCPVLGIPIEIGTGEKIDNSPSLDKVVPSIGYVVGNVHVISDKANRLKSNATLSELEAIVAYLKRELKRGKK